ncbi:hypothetical protein [Rhodococcus artemisiae]|jgi:hypothetical protein|uniref:Uncharacterized protein n=1 Tax=Rhodococcus artemisiae TaxID=714159 RepID=A0ABU7L4D5_9NOCA|nr:hypothetical protein [Rhodococcus artemisiae]MEE2056227.1 hypothetical protein [Rhodococcus artemisiae]
MSTPPIVAGPDAVVGAVVRVLTPPLCELYALLMRTGVLIVDDD